MTGSEGDSLVRQQGLPCRLFFFHSCDFSFTSFDIKRVVPLGDRDGADAITDQVGHRPRFVEEPINAQQQHKAYQRNGMDSCKRCSQRYKPRTRNTSRALEVSRNTANRII